MGDPWEVLVLHLFFANFSSRLFFLEDLPSAFVYSHTDASEAAEFGSVYFIIELSVLSRVLTRSGAMPGWVTPWEVLVFHYFLSEFFSHLFLSRIFFIFIYFLTLRMQAMEQY